jgi:hypothetical protein
MEISCSAKRDLVDGAAMHCKCDGAANHCKCDSTGKPNGNIRCLTSLPADRGAPALRTPTPQRRWPAHGPNP